MDEQGNLLGVGGYVGKLLTVRDDGLVSTVIVPREDEEVARRLASDRWTVEVASTVDEASEKMRWLAWNVPHGDNPRFRGRGDEFRKIEAALGSGRRVALTQATLFGLGGVGKTELAVQYAYRHVRDYRVIAWVEAEEMETLESDFVSLARFLPPGRGSLHEATIHSVRAWFEENTGWLLVFDNVPAPESLTRFMPRSGTGHVIVTSRFSDWAPIAQPMEVDVLHRDASIDFILEATGEADMDGARALADELGDLPIALEQACAYMRQTGRSIRSYLALWTDDKNAHLLDAPHNLNERTVARTWRISFQQIANESDAAATLMKLFAFMGGEEVPRPLLEDQIERLPNPLNERVRSLGDLDSGVSALRRYSLIKVSSAGFSVHRLVQTVSRSSMTASEQQAWARCAVLLLRPHFPTDLDNVRTWDVRGRLSSHALTVTDRAIKTCGPESEAALLLSGVGLYLKERHDISGARALQERALAIAEEAKAELDARAEIVNNLGRALNGEGDYAEARRRFESALELDLKHLGTEEHIKVAIRLNNLGIVAWNLGDHPAARAYFMRAITVYEKVCGPDDDKLAFVMANLAGLHVADGDQGAGQELYERALAIYRTVFGAEAPEVAETLERIGRIDRTLGDQRAAREKFETSISIMEKFHGSTSSELVDPLLSLAELLAQTDLQAAQGHLERALIISEQSEDVGAHTQITVLLRLGELLAQTDLQAAQGHLERALQQNEQSGNALVTGTLLHHLGRAPRAEPGHQRGPR